MINFNRSPYFDDFDKSNKFYRILYRPSYAVQGRELTQSQSIIQEQIKKVGDHIFEHGAMVIPGQITLDKEVSYQKMINTYGTPPYDIEVDPVNFLGFTIVGASSGVEGDIVNVAPSDDTDPLTFIIKFKNSGDDNESIGFWDGEEVYRKDDSQIRATVAGTLNIADPTYDNTGKASIASIGKGVYYIDGIFVDNDEQSIIVSKYDQTPTCSVGLRINETIVTPEDDLALTDNAQGSPNYSAPGAHRYKIDLKLEYVLEEDSISDDFIILQYLKQGIIIKEIRTSEYSELEKTFARRTFDESGNYTVDPFSIIIKEHFRDEDDDQYKEGVYTAPIGDTTKLVAEMGTGKAYVQGYEILKISKSNVEIDKARDFDIANNAVTNFSLGNYIEVNSVHNIPRIDEFGEIELYETVATAGTNNGDQVGSAKVRAIKRFDDDDFEIDAYLYIFDISMIDGKSFEDDVKWIYDSNGAGTNNFTCVPYIVDAKLFLYRVADNTLIFNLGHKDIKTLSVGGSGVDTNYQSTRAYFNSGIVGGTATLVAQDNEVFQQNTADWYVADSSTGLQVANPTFTFSGTPTGKIVEIGNLSDTVNVIAPVNKTIIAEKTKDLQLDGSIHILAPNKKQNDRDYLGKADVVQLKNVYMSQDFDTVANDTDTDITSRYVLDNGQKDNYYDVGSIILKGGEIAPTGRLYVTFDYFTHTDGDYFSVDSYTPAIDYDEIPAYRSKENGISYTLADCYDFRPRMADDRSGFTGAGGSIGELPQVLTDIRADYEYYLNRIDYLYLDYVGEFRIAKGVSAIHPKPPENPETGMILYEIFVNSYTFTPEDVEPKFKDNKRYTMGDIGNLDRRISNLEYYTSLSLLERETSSMEILDENGLNRFKNGFIVDPFDSHLVGENSHTDYECSIDPTERQMHPKFNDDNIGLVYDDANSSNVQRTGGIITLPYTTEVFNKQAKASKYENINPFAYRNIFGKIRFNPNSDVWHDKKTQPTLVVNHSPNYQALKFMAKNGKGLNGTTYGSWNNVGGKFDVNKSVTKSSKWIKEDRRATADHDTQGWIRDTKITSIKASLSYKQNQQRKGKKVTHTDKTVTSKKLGKRITEINYIPYMRSIPVLIKTDQLKVDTKVYPFFDDISMSTHCDPPSKLNYCTPASILNFSSRSGNFRTWDYREERVLGLSSGAKGIAVFQGSTYLQIVNVSGTFIANETVQGQKTGSTCIVSSFQRKYAGSPIITGNHGEVRLIWKIPNDKYLRFMTGERKFNLTDQITNADPVHTYAKGMFKSHGMSSKQQNTVLSTKTIQFNSTPVKQSKTVKKSFKAQKTVVEQSGWYDPIAQSFKVTTTGGCFLTNVMVYFQSKDTKEGVVCEIRNMVNGYPSEISMAETTLAPSEVTTSERKPGTGTSFTFSEPVYLLEDEDYCFVLKPAVASAKYQVWVSENGRKDIKSGDVITGKESLGSFFKSQNASTWTADQNEDIMYSLYKAKFNIASTGNVQLVNDEIESELLNINPVETYINTSKIRVYHPDHALTVGSTYNISGFEVATLYNGIIGSTLNGTHTILDVEIDSFTFDCGVNATDTGLTGGEEIYGTRNYQLDLARPLVNELLVDGTAIDWTMTTTTGTSVNGTQTAYNIEEPIDVINNEDIHMSKPMIIASSHNETDNLAGAKSFKMNGSLTSENENVSPVVDASEYDPDTNKGEDLFFEQSSSTLIAISHRIDDPDTTTWTIGTDMIFSVGAGEDELVITHTNHEMGTGSHILIENFTDTIDGIVDFDPNGLHEIRIIDQNSYLVDMKESSGSGYAGSGGGSTTIAYSGTHFKYVPETKSFNCSTASRYITKQVNLDDPAENFKLFFGAVREQYADIDVYYKVRSPYEVTEWNDIDWIRIDSPDEDVAISESYDDFKDFAFTIENLEPFNAISIKLVMKSNDSTQVPIFSDFRLICTT